MPSQGANPTGSLTTLHMFHMHRFHTGSLTTLYTCYICIESMHRFHTGSPTTLYTCIDLICIDFIQDLQLHCTCYICIDSIQDFQLHCTHVIYVQIPYRISKYIVHMLHMHRFHTGSLTTLYICYICIDSIQDLQLHCTHVMYAQIQGKRVLLSQTGLNICRSFTSKSFTANVNYHIPMPLSHFSMHGTCQQPQDFFKRCRY